MVPPNTNYGCIIVWFYDSMFLFPNIVFRRLELIVLFCFVFLIVCKPFSFISEIDDNIFFPKNAQV